MSTPTLRRSAIAARSSSAVSPIPRMIPDLVTRPASFAARQHCERAEVVRGRPCGALEARHGLEVVVQHVGARREDHVERVGVALAVGDQHLDRGRGHARPHRRDRRREPRRAAVGNVVARDARDHRVLEPEGGDRVARRAAGSSGSIGQRLAGVDEAEPARTRAPVTEDHERRGAIGPALVDVRAPGFLAHRVQLEPPHQPLRLPEPHTQIRLHPHPRRPLHPPLRGFGVSRRCCVPMRDGKPCGRGGLDVDLVVGEVAGERRGQRVDDRAHLGRGAEQRRHRRDPTITDPARHDVGEHPEIRAHVQCEPVARATHARSAPRSPRSSRRPPTPREARHTVRRDAELGERVDDDVLERAHVGDHVTLAVAPLRERHDRVADQLPRAVVRDVTAAIRAHQLRAHARRRYEHVLGIRARAQRVDVRMLEQQQVVVGRALVQRALQPVALGVGHPTEPAGPQHHSSSASQSRCSSTSFIAPRNAAA